MLVLKLFGIQILLREKMNGEKNIGFQNFSYVLNEIYFLKENIFFKLVENHLKYKSMS